MRLSAREGGVSEEGKKEKKSSDEGQNMERGPGRK